MKHTTKNQQNEELLQITPEDRVVHNPTIGQKYYLSTHGYDYSWTLINITGHKYQLEAPISKRKVIAHEWELRHTNVTALKHAQLRLQEI